MLMNLEQVKVNQITNIKEVDENITKFIKTIKQTANLSCASAPLVMRLSIINPILLKAEGEELQKKISNHLTLFFVEKYGVEKAPAEMGFKKIYNRILFCGKKNYAGREIWDEKEGWRVKIDTKGLSPIRSDNSILEKVTVETLLKLILNEEKDTIIKSVIRKTLKDFDDRKFNVIDISYPQQIKKRIWYDRKNNVWKTAYAHLDKSGKPKFPSHARAVLYGNMFLNTNYETGDKPRRLPIFFDKRLKLEEGQQLLFGKPDEVPFPTEWMYKGHTGGIKKDMLIKVKDIPISEDYSIPQFFLDHIDYQRIKERLENKIMTILDIHYKETLKREERQSFLKME